jgi:hypothetical protein
MNDDRYSGLRLIAVLAIAFWAAIVTLFLFTCEAKAAGFQVYLDGEEDLGNGYKLCHYTEGVTITVESHRLCPLSINVGDDE